MLCDLTSVFGVDESAVFLSETAVGVFGISFFCLSAVGFFVSSAVFFSETGVGVLGVSFFFSSIAGFFVSSVFFVSTTADFVLGISFVSFSVIGFGFSAAFWSETAVGVLGVSFFDLSSAGFGFSSIFFSSDTAVGGFGVSFTSFSVAGFCFTSGFCEVVVATELIFPNLVSAFVTGGGVVEATGAVFAAAVALAACCCSFAAVEELAACCCCCGGGAFGGGASGGGAAFGSPSPLAQRGIVAPLVVQGGAPFTWRLGGWQGGTGYLGVSLVDSVAPLQGFPVLTEFLPLWVGPLDSRGLASVTVPSVPPALAGFPFYSQLVDEIAGTGAVRSSSLVLRTLIY